MYTKIFSQKVYFVILFTFALLVLPFLSNAQSFVAPATVSGYAWSPNIGWISMSGSNYGVYINPGGAVTGFAWSPNIGWIKFGGLPVANAPAGGGQAKIDLTTNEFSGWVRALNYGSGWDGWISLSASNHGASSYGLTVGPAGFLRTNSYAWGSDTMGWISFGGVRINTPCTTSRSCTADGLGMEIANMWCNTEIVPCASGRSCLAATAQCVDGEDMIQVQPPIVRTGEAVTVQWRTIPGAYGSCYVEGHGDRWNGFSGSRDSSPFGRGGSVYGLWCDGIEIERTEVKVLPIISES